MGVLEVGLLVMTGTGVGEVAIGGAAELRISWEPLGRNTRETMRMVATTTMGRDARTKAGTGRSDFIYFNIADLGGDVKF